MRIPIKNQRAKMSTSPSAIPWTVYLERFKKFLDYGKDAVELIAKFSLLLLVLPGLTLWIYLDRIGWHTLFLDSISSTSGLLALLIGTLLLVSALLFVLCTPSIFLLFLLVINKDVRILSRSTSIVILASVLAWMTLVIIASTLTDNLSIGFLLLGTFTFCVVATLLGWRIEKASMANGKLRTLGKAAGLSLFITIAAVSSSAGFLTIESFAGDMSTNAKAYSALTILLPLTLVGFLPGLMAIGMAARSKPATTAIKYVAVGIAFVLYVLVTWSLTSLSTGIGTRALEKTGVYNTTLQSFELLNKDARASLERVGIPVTPSGLPIIRAYVRYAFGDIRLLCADEFIPGVTDALEERFSSDPDDLKKSRNKALDAGRNCVMLKKDDIRPIRLKQSP
ncbi:hypothetical protein [Burkholderia contaminans]|uniref:Uncharacterized protein n=1 Tax=Burkholderia contaminans TaxID=488447 RepID=A0A3N8PN02_9BURK|nr:hypothetical protein [Burkholderia contaminans]RQT12675.1 hypothetical protein DF051_22655 [Burkholderia contaminans]